MIVIGIDPGIAKIGFAVIENKGNKVIDYGCITTSKENNTGERLEKISQEISKLIKQYKPKVLAIENLYFFKNLKTAMPVSQAKGVILLTASQNKIPVFEFTPLQMKMAVTGYGRAEKKQVQKMIKLQLNLKETKDKGKRQDDAIDALGIALCYIFQAQAKNNINKKILLS